jgi:multidrug resistance efflux pump
MHDLKTLRELRKENHVLQHELSDVRASLEEAEARAARAQRSAEEAWGFAQAVLRTGRGDRARQP